MKAGILMICVAILVAALWMSGVFSSSARHILITEVTASPMGNDAIVAVLKIENQGAPDRLLGVSSADTSVQFQNAARGLPIPTGRSALAHDAAHILITPPGGPLAEGDLIPLALQFETAGDVRVKARFARPEPGSSAAHMAMGHGMMLENISGDAIPELSLTAKDVGSGWVAHIQTRNFSFSKDMQDGKHVTGTGHGHIYVGDMKLGRVFADTFTIGPLPTGKHLVRVTLNTNDHRPYAVAGSPISAETFIEVD
ncbi:MAG: copper chaperone PCu(A)C [Rhodobacteraceae bacterium]|nr:copper chaperone PCu(A)C [Paracoccaceae bacterium]